MKKNKILKIALIVLIVFYSIFAIVNSVNADYDWSLDRVDGKKDDTISGKAEKIMGSIVDVVRVVGTGVAIIMIIFVAIKYMTAAPGERADIKKHAIPFVVGAIVLFASTNILSIIKDFATTNL